MEPGLELLTNDEMRLADRLAAMRDGASRELMERAGRAVADVAIALLAARKPALTESGVSQKPPEPASVLVLCGRGNNGGDGFVAARLLHEAGLDVRVALAGHLKDVRGDAAIAAAEWVGPIEPLSPDSLGQGADLIVDAMLGAGISGPVASELAQVIDALNASAMPVLAVDVPSGIDGTSGEVRGTAVVADTSVTFVRRKPGHLLFPGRTLSGVVHLADIGMPERILAEVAPRTYANAPALWSKALPRPSLTGHKFDRGHAVVLSGGPDSTGAARLGAAAALRVGAGLVTVASPFAALPINACQLTAIMLRRCDDAGALGDMLADRRKNAVLLGPGLGVGQQTLELTRAALNAGAAIVLDADALTSVGGESTHVFDLIGHSSLRPVVLTPHEGEFARLFPGVKGSKLARARKAAEISHATVVLKGPDTVIAHPEGRAAINENAPPDLATAGSGDVLAGLIVGLLAQRMPVFEAACAAVWMHGAAAAEFGRGLIAEDLPGLIPTVLKKLA